jgi:CRISPR-associated endonuclease/helicase Cas3
MIGSGLLFSRYTRRYKTRPLHAGFLAQDTLLVHDEAHLEPCFQSLLETIIATQQADGELRKLHVIALTATNRAATANSSAPFTLTEADRENQIISKRINATKRLVLIGLGEEEKLDAKLVALAKAKPEGRAVLIFSRSIETTLKVATELDKGDHTGKVATLTGTMRGKERDELVSGNPVFQRFLSEKDRSENIAPSGGTVFLVATSAGEVGVNLSADDLVCDLSTYESMAQRFGRVNRFGDCDDSTVTVVIPTPEIRKFAKERADEKRKAGRDAEKKAIKQKLSPEEVQIEVQRARSAAGKDYEQNNALDLARIKTLKLLSLLKNSASPAALESLPPAERAAAFSPPPRLRVATDIQFDAWALTSIREPIAARRSRVATA